MLVKGQALDGSTGSADKVNDTTSTLNTLLTTQDVTVLSEFKAISTFNAYFVNNTVGVTAFAIVLICGNNLGNEARHAIILDCQPGRYAYWTVPGEGACYQDKIHIFRNNSTSWIPKQQYCGALYTYLEV